MYCKLLGNFVIVINRLNLFPNTKTHSKLLHRTYFDHFREEAKTYLLPDGDRLVIEINSTMTVFCLGMN